MDNRATARLGGVGGEVGDNEIVVEQVASDRQRHGMRYKFHKDRIEIEQIEHAHIVRIRIQSLHVSRYASALTLGRGFHQTMAYVSRFRQIQDVFDDAE